MESPKPLQPFCHWSKAVKQKKKQVEEAVEAVESKSRVKSQKSIVESNQTAVTDPSIHPSRPGEKEFEVTEERS